MFDGDIKKFIIEFDMTKRRNFFNRAFEVLFHVFVDEIKHVRIIPMLPPASKVLVITSISCTQLNKFIRSDAAGFKIPALHKLK